METTNSKHSNFAFNPKALEVSVQVGTIKEIPMVSLFNVKAITDTYLAVGVDIQSEPISNQQEKDSFIDEVATKANQIKDVSIELLYRELVDSVVTQALNGSLTNTFILKDGDFVPYDNKNTELPSGVINSINASMFVNHLYKNSTIKKINLRGNDYLTLHASDKLIPHLEEQTQINGNTEIVRDGYKFSHLAEVALGANITYPVRLNKDEQGRLQVVPRFVRITDSPFEGNEVVDKTNWGYNPDWITAKYGALFVIGADAGNLEFFPKENGPCLLSKVRWFERLSERVEEVVTRPHHMDEKHVGDLEEEYKIGIISTRLEFKFSLLENGKNLAVAFYERKVPTIA